MTLNKYINYVEFDDKKRIIVSVNVIYQSFLHIENIRQLLKKAIIDILKDDFVRLEIGKNRVRITVREGTEEKNINIIRTELQIGLEKALQYMGTSYND